MDISAFEATASDVPDPPLADVKDLVEDDLKYAIAGAIAVVKHVIKLVLLITALATCIAIYCILLNWLCLIWLQTRLLLVTAAILRSSMDEPRRSQLDAGEVTHQPEIPAVKDQEEEVVSPDATEQAQKTETRQRRPQMPEEWRQPDFEGVGETTQGEAWANGEHERNQRIPAAAWARQIAEQEQERAQWNSFGDQQQAANKSAHVQTSLNGHNMSMPPTARPQPRRGPIEQPRQPRAPRPEPPKLSKEEQKAHDQEAWLGQLTSAAPPGAGAVRTQSKPPTIEQPPANPFNLGFTAEQLASAAEFAASATRGGERSKKTVTSTKPTNPPSKASRASTPSHFKRSQPVMMHSGNANISPGGTSRPAQSASAVNEAASNSRSGSVSIPPHLRKAKRVISKQSVSEEIPSVVPQAPLAMMAAPQTEEVEEEVQPETSSAGHENIAPAMADEHVDHMYTRQQETMGLSDVPAETPRRQTPILRQQTTRLDFYEDTPLLENPAPRAMSAKTLKMWSTPSSSEMQTQALRLQNSDAGLLVAKSQSSKPLQSLRPSNRVTRGMSAGRVGKLNPFDSSPAAARYERPDESDPFMTPVKLESQTSTELPKSGDHTHQGRIVPETEDQSSLLREYPTAAEFEAALFAQQVQEDLEEQARKTTQPSEAVETPRDEVEESSTPSSKRRASIAQQAVKIIQDQAHEKHASTSTFVTAREDATPTQHVGQQSEPSSLDKTDSITKVPAKATTDQSSGSRSSKLTPSAPSFFAPVQTSNTATPTSRKSLAPGPSQPPLPDSSTTHTSFSNEHHGSTVSRFVSNPYTEHVQQPYFPSTPHAPQYLGDPGSTYGYASAPSYNSALSGSALQQDSRAIPYEPVPTLSHYTPRPGLFVPQYAPMSAPSMTSFGSDVTAPINLYLPRAASSMPSFAPQVNPYSPGLASGTVQTGQDYLTPLTRARFLGNYDYPSSHKSGDFETLYQTPVIGNQRPSSNGVAIAQPSLSGALTVPLRRPSLAVPITRPPPTPERPLDINSESTFPPLRTAPLPAQATTLKEGLPKPPGLGDPKPSRQVAFDALVRDVSPRRKAVISAFSGVDPARKAVDEAQFRMRRLAELKGFSESFKVPAGLKPQHADDEEALARRDSSIGGGKVKKAETSAEETSAEDEAMEVATIANKPQQAVVARPDDGSNDQGPTPASSHKEPTATTSEAQETVLEDSNHDANDQEPVPVVPASSDKKAKREAKKMAREAVTEAWGTREIARKKVVGSWSPDGAIDLRESTHKYHERRAELESLMGGGKLNDEDAKVFPRFPDLDLSAPKSRPDGAIDAQKKRKEDKTGSPPENNSASHGPTGRSGEKRKASNSRATEQAYPLPSEFESLKEKLETAQKLLRQARDYKKQGRPQSNISYATWKRDGDAKVERATKFYRSKREALAAAFVGGLPDALAEDFPLI